MNLKKFLFCITAMFHLTIFPFSFSNLFKTQTHKDPAHEEIYECIRNKTSLGTLLGGCASGLLVNSLVLNRELSSWITIPPISLLIIASIAELSSALELYIRHTTPEKSALRIAQIKSGSNYFQEIEQWRKMNIARHNILHDKQLYVGTAAILAGFLMSYTELDNKNPALILTVAGIGIIAEKIISELTKS